MKNLKQIANTLYVLFNVFFWLALFAAGAVVVVTVIFFVLGLPMDTLKIGTMEFSLNDQAVDVKSLELKFIMLTQMLSAVVNCVFLAIICKKLKEILHPIKSGEPFMSNVGKNIGKLGNITCVFGVCSIITQIISVIAVTVFVANNENIFKNDYILSYAFEWKSDLTWIIVSLVLYLIAYVFEYGRELQELSDETL